MQWVTENSSPNSDLEFDLRKEEFIQILLKDTDTSILSEPLIPSTLPSPHAQSALAYGGNHFRSLVTPSRQASICALLTSPLYMPFSRLMNSPYATIYSEYAETKIGNGKLSASFAAVYLKHLELPRHSPLSVVTDIGGGGALAVIQKVRAVMKEKRTEWSAIEELPVSLLDFFLPFLVHWLIFLE